MLSMRNFLFKVSLFSLPVLLALYLWGNFLSPSTFGLKYPHPYYTVWTWVRDISQILSFAFPVAFISVLMGKSRKSSLPEALPSGASRIWTTAVVTLGVALVAPVLFLHFLCLGSSAGSGCGVIGFFFLPMYAVAVPAFLISVLGLIITKMRR